MRRNTETREQVKRGLCSCCGLPREKERKPYWRCMACEQQVQEKRKKFRDDEVGEVTLPYAATIPCYRCRKPFHSSDRRAVRFCQRCKEWINHAEDMIGEAGMYD
jgi:hypothetical protein